MTEKLHKSKSNKMIAGVCGGIAEYFNVDATLIRLAWILAVFFGGSGIALYIIAMIIIPEKANTVVKSETTKPAEGGQIEKVNEEKSIDEKPQTEPVQNQEGKKQQVLGLILVGLGCYFILQRFFPRYFSLHDWWPMILIIIGLGVLIRSSVGKNK